MATMLVSHLLAVTITDVDAADGHQLPGEPARPLTLPIEKMGISTDGASLNIPFTTKVQRAGPNDPFADYQNRRELQQ